MAVNLLSEAARKVAGFFDGARSLLVGFGITARRALRRPTTVRYPHEKVTISPGWRGPLKVRSFLGEATIELLTTEPGQHNELVDALHKSHRLPPCIGACPANVDARGQGYLVADGKSVEAYELVRERNVLPGVLGRICHHPCESSCRRAYYDEALAIRPLHRHVYEEFTSVAHERLTPIEPWREERVAVIGAGPSGLAAAYDLLRLGYHVAIYEKESRPGGALLTGVPVYRLPRDVLSTEIGYLVSLGIELKLGIEVGVDVPIDYLTGEYDALLIAAGLQRSRMVQLPGVDAEGVADALSFLRRANTHSDIGISGKRVLVIGGGNVAVDVARCALRHRASEVRLACLEGDSEMPCHPWEIEEAFEEGVIAHCSLGPVEVLKTPEGRVRGVTMRECLSVFDVTGRFAPRFGDVVTELACDVVVFAVGQVPDLAHLVAGSDLRLTDQGLLPVDGVLLTTQVSGVFACGEVVTGPGSAIGSIASGHEAATSIDRYLQGESLIQGRVYRPVPTYLSYPPADLTGVERSRLRVRMPMASPDERATDFRAVELGITNLEALNEAARCLRCQSEVCVGCAFCARTCPDCAIVVERVDDPGQRKVTRFDVDVSACCFCGLCAEQCPTDALVHTGEYEMSLFDRRLAVLDRCEMVREGSSTRLAGRAAGLHGTDGCENDGELR